jgi:hypothetical protein
LGYNLVDNVFNFGGGDDNNNNNSSDNNDDGGSLLDNIVNGAKDVVDGVTDKVEDWANDIGNEIADRLAEELGVSEWYSVHVMTACQGDFTPNATAPDAGYNTTNCTGSALGCKSLDVGRHRPPIVNCKDRPADQTTPYRQHQHHSAD